MKLESIELERLEYYRPLRSNVDARKITDLKNSIDLKGFISPILAVKNGKTFNVVDGVLRLEIAKELGWAGNKRIDVIIIDDPDTYPLEATLLLNTFRQELSALDEALIINDLISEHGYKKERVSQILGKSETIIENFLRIFRLPPNILRALKNDLVTIAHCHQLARLSDDQKILNLVFKKTIEESLTPRDLEILVSSQLDDNKVGDYKFFPPFVIKTSAGSRLRFEPRKKSIRMELNVISDDFGDVVMEMKAQLRKLTKSYLKTAG